MVSTDYLNEDTIAATATPPGEGGIAITRISGKDALPLLKKIFKAAGTTNPHGGEMESHRLYYGRVIDPERNTVLDSALAVVMKSPHSYTGEDVVEIHSHGGYLLPKRIVELCCQHGARPARPGEFTLRAFLNGKMDLAQAEAVSDVVNAETEESLRLAEMQLEGALSSKLCEYDEALLDALAEVEAQVDFPEEEIDPLVKDRIKGSITGLREKILGLVSTFEEGRIIKHGVSTAIVGKPNVGKSSLLNQLLMKERALVTPQPGTTRDFIEESISAGGIPLRLVDTAGIRATADEVEQLGVELARKKAAEAELVIAVLDGSGALEEDDLLMLKAISEQRSIVVINKCDLGEGISEYDIRRYIQAGEVVRTSAKTGEGIEDLKRKIEKTVLGHERPREGGEFLLTETRHRKALERASNALSRFLEALERGESPEFLALDLRLAMDSIGEITGETTTEDILGRIFSKFCIGK